MSQRVERARAAAKGLGFADAEASAAGLPGVLRWSLPTMCQQGRVGDRDAFIFFLTSSRYGDSTVTAVCVPDVRLPRFLLRPRRFFARTSPVDEGFTITGDRHQANALLTAAVRHFLRLHRNQSYRAHDDRVVCSRSGILETADALSGLLSETDALARLLASAARETLASGSRRDDVERLDRRGKVRLSLGLLAYVVSLPVWVFALVVVALASTDPILPQRWDVAATLGIIGTALILFGWRVRRGA